MENFIKIKNRKKRNAFLRSGIIGGGVAVTAASIPVMVYTLMDKSVPWLWVILGAVLLGGLTFLGILLCLYPFNKRLARALDKTMGGGEKVQTMVEFAESDEEMKVLQRKDTEERLNSVPSSVYQFKHVWQCIAAACLAFVTLAGAMIVSFLPKDTGGGGNGGGDSSQNQPQDEAFEFTEFQETALRQLIEYVQKSEMAQGLKDSTVAQLEGLIGDLPVATTRNEMLEKVNAVITSVDEAVENVNNGFDLATTMTQTGQPLVGKLGNAVGAVELDRFATFYNECADGFKPFTKRQEGVEPRNGTGEDEFSEGKLAENNITQFSIALTSALVASKVDPADPLYQAIKNLHDKLFRLRAAIHYYAEGTWANEIEKLFNECAAPFTVALSAEIANDETRDYVIRKLKEIFGLSNEEAPETSKDFVAVYTEDDEQGDDEIHSGGLGTGDYNFPSDELIYNPATGEHIRYGELLAEYYNRYTDALQKGEIDEELEMILQAYFDLLSATQKAPTE